MPYIGYVDVPQQALDDYSDEWKTEIQQLGSKLKSAAMVKTGLVGESIKYGRVSSTEMNETAKYDKDGATPEARNRHQLIEVDELKLSSAFMTWKEFDKHLWHQYDDSALLGGIDAAAREATPMLKAAFARVIDRVILGVSLDKTTSAKTYGKPIIDKASDFNNHGIFGGTLEGVSFGAATRQYLPDAATVVSSLGGATAGAPTGMNIAKLLKIRRILDEREVVDDTITNVTQIVVLVTPEMVTQLIADEERLGSSDYGFQALKDGNLLDACGLRFVKTNNLPYIKEGVKYVRRAVAYNPAELYFGIWKELNIEIKDQPSRKKSFTTGGYAKIGCVRRDDNAFITVDCLTDDITA